MKINLVLEGTQEQIREVLRAIVQEHAHAQDETGAGLTFSQLESCDTRADSILESAMERGRAQVAINLNTANIEVDIAERA